MQGRNETREWIEEEFGKEEMERPAPSLNPKRNSGEK